MSNVIKMLPEPPHMPGASARQMELVRILYGYGFRGEKATACSLMMDLNIKFALYRDNIMPHTAYTEFAFLLANVRRILARSGWDVNSTGGHFYDRIWISKQSASSG